jgi:hypothetical protein
VFDANGNPQATASTSATSDIVDGSVTPAKLSTGGPNWDASGNVTATSYIGIANTWAGANTWITKSANYTALPYDRILASTSGGVFTITLPLSPTLGYSVTIIDNTRTWATNNLTVARNGSTIEGLSEDLTCNVSGKLILVIYDGTTWRIY